MEWISVKDRLPEKPMFVIVYCPDYTNYMEPIFAQWVKGKDGFIFLDFDPMNMNDITEDVTHWMPSPKPPEISTL